MRRGARWWVFALIAISAPIAAATVPVPQDDASCGTMKLKDCVAHYWEGPKVMLDEVVKKWRIAIRVAKWEGTGLCGDVMAAATEIFSNNIDYDGASDAPDVKVLAKVGKGQYDAQHMHADSSGGRGAVVFVNYFTEEMLWAKIQHEAAHHAGKNEADAKKAESCAERDKEKENEDDDDDDGGGGGGGGTGWNPGETCTTTTEWVFAGYRDCSYWGGPSGMTLVVCTEEIWIPTEVVTCS